MIFSAVPHETEEMVKISPMARLRAQLLHYDFGQFWTKCDSFFGGALFFIWGHQRPARFSFLENSREFFFIFTSRSRSRAVSISLSLLEKEWRDFIFHFSLLEKSESYPYFTLFSREKRVKSGAGYNLTSIFVPNCISKNCQISSKHQPQNIGQISISKSWLNPVLHVWTKKVTKNSALISWPNFSFSTKLSLIRSSSTLTSFQLGFLHTRVTSVKFGTERQTRQCNDRTWIW